MLNTPGERRTLSPEILDEGVKKGVIQGLFGLGEISENGELTCRYFKEEPSIASIDTEVLINERLCKPKTEDEGLPEPQPPPITDTTLISPSSPDTLDIEELSELKLDFTIPQGQVSSIMGIMNFLQTKFESLEIKLKASGGLLPKDEYVRRIEVTFKQMEINEKVVTDYKLKPHTTYDCKDCDRRLKNKTELEECKKKEHTIRIK